MKYYQLYKCPALQTISKFKNLNSNFTIYANELLGNRQIRKGMQFNYQTFTEYLFYTGFKSRDIRSEVL